MKVKFTLLFMFFCTYFYAQVKVGDNPTTIDADAVLEVESTNKGLLLPRVALVETTNVAPLANHVAGMTVYNTATANDVTPGYYYNDGTQWVRIISDDIDEWEDASLANGFTGAQLVDNVTGARTFAGDDGSLFIGNDGRDADPLSTTTSGISVQRTYEEGVTDDNSVASNFFITNGVTTSAQALRGATIEEETNTDDISRMSGNFSAAVKLGSGNVTNNMTGGITRASTSSTATGNIASLNSAQSNINIDGNVTVDIVRNLDLLNVVPNGSAQATTTLVGIDIRGNAFTAANRNVENKYGIRIDNIRESNVSPGGDVFAIYTNAGKVSLGDTLQLRSVPTGTPVSGLGVDTDGNVITTTATASEWEDGTFGGQDLIYARQALANNDTIAVTDEGKLYVGGSFKNPDFDGKVAVFKDIISNDGIFDATSIVRSNYTTGGTDGANTFDAVSAVGSNNGSENYRQIQGVGATAMTGRTATPDGKVITNNWNGTIDFLRGSVSNALLFSGSAANTIGVRGNAQHQSSGTSTNVIGVDATAALRSTTGGTATNAFGVRSATELGVNNTGDLTNATGMVSAINLGAGNSGNITTSRALQLQLNAIASNAGNIANARGLEINAFYGGGTITNYEAIRVANFLGAVNANDTYGINILNQDGATDNNYGINVGNITGATTNYSVYTNAGTVSIGDTLEVRASEVDFGNLPVYADDAAAGVGGVQTGFLYQTPTGEVRIKL